MDHKLVEQIHYNFRSKTTDELLVIWSENNHELWSDEAIEAAKEILMERGVSLPIQQKEYKPMERGWKIQWEVKTLKDDIILIENNTQLKKRILDGSITLNMFARKIDRDQQDKDKEKAKWVKVSDGLAKSAFDIQVLFKPIWAHSLKGSSIAIKLGIIISLISTAFQIDNGNISFWLFYATFFVIILSLIGEESLKFLAPATGGFIYFSKYFPNLWNVLWISAQIIFGVITSSTILFLFPGMIIGTIVGLKRLRTLQVSPHAPVEKNMLLKGIILPAISFSIIILLYIKFVNFFINKL